MMTMRFAHMFRVAALPLMVMAGCASEPEPRAGALGDPFLEHYEKTLADPSLSEPLPPEILDPSTLDDAALAARIDLLTKRVHALMKRDFLEFRRALSANAPSTQPDVEAQAEAEVGRFLETLEVEKQLGRLENEQIRRSKMKTKAGK